MVRHEKQKQKHSRRPHNDHYYDRTRSTARQNSQKKHPVTHQASAKTVTPVEYKRGYHKSDEIKRVIMRTVRHGKNKQTLTMTTTGADHTKTSTTTEHAQPHQINSQKKQHPVNSPYPDHHHDHDDGTRANRKRKIPKEAASM